MTDVDVHQWCQTAFNKAWEGLASQGWEKCTDQEGSCVWAMEMEGGEVRHCAVGWLIDPEKMPPMDEYGVVQGEYETALAEELLIPELPTLNDVEWHYHHCKTCLGELQLAHDTNYTHIGMNMVGAMERVAAKYGLKVPND